jgi:hypothetical protein
MTASSGVRLRVGEGGCEFKLKDGFKLTAPMALAGIKTRGERHMFSYIETLVSSSLCYGKRGCDPG